MWTGPIKNSLTTTELFDDNGIFEILSEKDVGEECLEKVPLKILIFLLEEEIWTVCHYDVSTRRFILH